MRLEQEKAHSSGKSITFEKKALKATFSARRGDCPHNELLPPAFDCDGLGGRHVALRKVFARRGTEGIKNFLAEGLPESPVKQSKRRLLFDFIQISQARHSWSKLRSALTLTKFCLLFPAAGKK